MKSKQHGVGRCESDLETLPVPVIEVGGDIASESVLEALRAPENWEVQGLAPLAVSDLEQAARLGSRGARVRSRDPKEVLRKRRVREKLYREAKKAKKVGRPRVHWKTAWSKQRKCEKRYYEKIKRVRMWDPWFGFRRKISNYKGRLGITKEEFEQVLADRIEDSRDYRIKVDINNIYNNIYNIYNITIIDKDTNNILYTYIPNNP